jgi:hypothetical protein
LASQACREIPARSSLARLRLVLSRGAATHTRNAKGGRVSARPW